MAAHVVFGEVNSQIRDLVETVLEKHGITGCTVEVSVPRPPKNPPLHPRIARATSKELMEVATRILGDSGKAYTRDEIAAVLSAMEYVNDEIARAHPHLTYRERRHDRRPLRGDGPGGR
jgi:hypothetical protein